MGFKVLENNVDDLVGFLLNCSWKGIGEIFVYVDYVWCLCVL